MQQAFLERSSLVPLTSSVGVGEKNLLGLHRHLLHLAPIVCLKLGRANFSMAPFSLLNMLLLLLRPVLFRNSWISPQLIDRHF